MSEEAIERLCPECRCNNLMWDEKRAELYCFSCGLLLVINPPYYSGNRKIKPAGVLLVQNQIEVIEKYTLLKRHQDYKSEEDPYGQKNSIKAYHKSIKEKGHYPRLHFILKGLKHLKNKRGEYEKFYKRKWEIKIFHELIEVFSTEYLMTNLQKQRSHYILEKILKKGNLRWGGGIKVEQIVGSICIYVMKEDRRDIVFRNNKFLREFGITAKKYKLIAAKLSPYAESEKIMSEPYIHRVSDL